MSLFRHRPRPAFDEREATVAASVSAPLAEAIRDHAQAPASVPARDLHEPGIMLFTPDGALVSVNGVALG